MAADETRPEQVSVLLTGIGFGVSYHADSLAQLACRETCYLLVLHQPEDCCLHGELLLSYDDIHPLRVWVIYDLHPSLVPLFRRDLEVQRNKGRDAFSPDCYFQRCGRSFLGRPLVEVNCDCHILQFARKLARVSGRKWPKMDINGQYFRFF